MNLINFDTALNTTEISSIKTGSDLLRNVLLLVRHRKEKDIKDMPQEMKDLWSWYALTLMTATARKDWKWKNEDKRTEEMFCDCVTVGDEALALSVLELKGEEYMEEKVRRRSNEYVKGKRGRRKKDSEGKKDDGLNHKVSAYLKHRESVLAMRNADPEDNLGWNGYIRTQVEEEKKKRGVKKRGVLLKNGYSTIEIPMDSLEAV